MTSLLAISKGLKRLQFSSKSQNLGVEKPITAIAALVVLLHEDVRRALWVKFGSRFRDETNIQLKVKF